MAILDGRGGFTPITKVSELPVVGHSVETRSIDFKFKHTATRLECAKDVAALANTSGGTILVGAQAAGDLLNAYVPLSAEDAQTAKRDYEEAVRDRCSPAPILEVAFIDQGSGPVVAVNVWPMPGQPVGVELKGKEGASHEQAPIDRLHFYPVRVASHTRAILPEQLPMFIDAKSRKAAIVLSRAIGKRLVMAVPKHEKNRLWREDGLKLLEVNPLENSITVEIDGKHRVSVPLDMIEAAWLEGEFSYIAVSGYIEQWDASSREGMPPESGGYFFMPLPRFMMVNPEG